jgi:hypothetical protein
MVVKKDDYRHKILQILFRKTDNLKYHNTPFLESQWHVTINEIAKELGVDNLDIKKLISVMFQKDEIGIGSDNQIEYLFIKQNGITAHNEEYYLNISFRRFNDRAYDITRWVIPLLLAIIAVYTLMVNGCNEQKNSQAIKQLNIKVDSLLSSKK